MILDEPTSALDVSVQARILVLLEELQERLGLAYLFIAHDLAVVESVADRVAVMYLGEIVESGAADAVLHAPRHPYTHALIASVPSPDPERRSELEIIAGEVPERHPAALGLPLPPALPLPHGGLRPGASPSRTTPAAGASSPAICPTTSSSGRRRQ